MARPASFRAGKVRAELLGSVWYLSYHENGRRLRPRVGQDRDAARQMAAQVNAQLEASAPTAFSFKLFASTNCNNHSWITMNRFCNLPSTRSDVTGQPPDIRSISSLSNALR